MNAEVSELDLEAAIEQQINLGLKNPHEVYQALCKQFGPEMVDALVQPHHADFVAYMARQRLNVLRRADIARITPSALTDKAILLRSLWVPSEDGIVYKRIADMTAEDFEKRAEYLERMVGAISRHATWCRDVAATIRERGVMVAGELDKLPALPESAKTPALGR